MIGTYHTTDYKMEQQNFVDGGVIERVNNVLLTASKGSLSEGAVSRRLTEGVPKGPAGLRRTPSVTASPCHLPLGGRFLDPGRSQFFCSFNYPVVDGGTLAAHPRSWYNSR